MSLPLPKRPPIPEHIFDEKLCLEMTGGTYLDCGEIKSDWNAMTVEAWVFPRTFDHHCLFSHTLSVTLKPEGIHTHNGPYDTTSAGFSIPADTWTHIAVTVDPTGLHRFYRNGHLMTTEQGETVQTGTSQHLLIGAANFDCVAEASADNRLFFEGKLGPVTVWKRARTQPEVIADMFFTPFRNAKDLIGCWLMEDIDSNRKGNRLHKVPDLKLPMPYHAHIKNLRGEDSNAQLIDAEIPKPHNTDMIEFFVNVDEITTEGVFEYIPDWCEQKVLDDLKADNGDVASLYKCAGNINELGTNADEDTYTMDTSTGRLMVFNATAHNPDWETYIKGFYSKELGCAYNITHKGKSAKKTKSQEDSHVLKDIAFIEDGRWMVARTSESGSIEYLVLIYMKRRRDGKNGKKGEERWVAWDPVIEVDNDPTDG